LLSAIEADLRKMLSAQFNFEKDIQSFLGPELFNKVLTRLHKDLGPNAYFGSLAEVFDYIDFADSYQLLNAKKANLPPEMSACIQTNTENLEKLIPIRNRVAHSRPLNFDDLAIVHDVGQSLLAQGKQLWTELIAVQEELR